MVNSILESAQRFLIFAAVLKLVGFIDNFLDFFTSNGTITGLPEYQWHYHPDSKDLWIDVNQISIQHNCVRSISNQHQSKDLCYLSSVLIWGLWHQKQVSQARKSNCIPQYSVGCNYLSLPEIPASGKEKYLQPNVFCGMQLLILAWDTCFKQAKVIASHSILWDAITYPCLRYLLQASKSTCIPKYSVGCNYLSLPEIPASGTKVLISWSAPSTDCL